MKRLHLLSLVIFPLLLSSCGNTDKRKLLQIEFETLPNKLAYIVGDTLDTTGALIIACYNNNQREDVTSSCVFSPSLFTDIGSVTVTASYTYKEVTKSASFNVMVASRPETVTFTVDTSEIPTGDFNSTTYPDKFIPCFDYNDERFISSLDVDGFAQVNKKDITTEEGKETIISLVLGSQKSGADMFFTFNHKLLDLIITAHPQYSAYYDYESETYVKKSSDNRNAITINDEEWVLRANKEENNYDTQSKTFEINSDTLMMSANAAERVCIRTITFTFEI